MAITNQTLAQVRDLRTAVGGEADQATRDITKQWVAGWDQTAPLYATALTGLAAAALAAGRWPGPWDLARDEPLQQAGRQAQAALSGLANTTGTGTVAAATRATEATVAAEPGIMASQLPAAARADAKDRFAEAVGAVGLAALLLAVAPSIGPLTSPLSTLSLAAISRVLTRGAPATSGTPKALAGRLLAEVEHGFNTGLTSAIALTRTETLDAYRVAARRVHTANDRWVAGWVWECSLDRRACPACWAMHGTEHPSTEPGPSGHRNCRCFRVVKLRPWSQLGHIGREPADRFPDGQARFRKLPEADQLAIMGPARLALLRSGQITWDDIAVLRTNPNWRSAYLPRTVADLQAIARKRAHAAA